MISLYFYYLFFSTNFFSPLEVAKLQREAAHLRQSADTAEATMKVLSQHAKALAQAHMKLQSAKEEADSNIKKSVLKVRFRKDNKNR